MSKICVIYNYAQHYRLPIFKLLNEQLKCSFYFGDDMKELHGVKKINYSYLPGFRHELENKYIFSHFYWQKGALSLLHEDYEKYIILGEYYCLSTWALLLLSKFSKKKIYLWSHGWYGNENLFKKILKKIFFSLSESTFLYGNYARNLMIKEGISPGKLHVIYNSLDYSQQIQIRKELKSSNVYSNYFKNEHPVTVFIGRLTKEKKLDQLIDAWKILVSKGSKINLVFIGTGDQEENIKKQISSFPNVWMYGACYDEKKIGELIYNSNVCVSPGNVGLTAIHSMVFGTPVITHNNFANQMPEFEAIIPGKTGDFFERDNVGELSVVLKKWISPVIDREEVRNQCFRIIEQKYNPYFQLKIISEVVND